MNSVVHSDVRNSYDEGSSVFNTAVSCYEARGTTICFLEISDSTGCIFTTSQRRCKWKFSSLTSFSTTRIFVSFDKILSPCKYLSSWTILSNMLKYSTKCKRAWIHIEHGQNEYHKAYGSAHCVFSR